MTVTLPSGRPLFNERPGGVEVHEMPSNEPLVDHG